MKLTFSVNGLDCANCAIKLEDKIKELDSVNLVSVNFLTEKIAIVCPDDIDKDKVFKEIKKVGKEVEPGVEIEMLK